MAPHALDKSLRQFDADGHMIVEMSRISKANICEYRGKEIPNSQALGLDPNKLYKLFRDPVELEKAASSFDGKPLLIRHMPISADLPSQNLWVGTLGKCSFEAPYLVTRPLTIITAEAQALVEAELKDELSAGYRYTAEMVPGVYGGEAYDGRMKDIQGNHVALVGTGRAGPDVHVADESILEPTHMPMKNMSLIKRLQAKIPSLAKLSNAEIMAMDAELGEVPAVSVVKLSADEEKAALDEAMAEKKAGGSDEELTPEEKEKALAKGRDKKAKDEEMKGKDKKGKDEKPDDKDKAADKKGKDEKPDDKKGEDGDPDHRRDFNSIKQGGADKAADKALDSMTMDEAEKVIAKGIAREGKRIRAEVTQQIRDLAMACDECAPLVGKLEVHAFDSAEDVYQFVCEKLDIEIESDFPRAGLRTLVRNELKHRAERKSPAGGKGGSKHAMDRGTGGFDADTLFQRH